MKRLLIANRGEIACRIIRTAHARGIETVALYTDADECAPHVAQATRAVRIGTGPVGESYLDAGKVLAAAQATGADAVHPGYGFLSENADFAQAVTDAGLIWVGPPPAAIRAMGNKAEAKRLMIAAGVPCVPGYAGRDQADTTLLAEADKIGVPLMVKAAAGGGGRGMRHVTDLAALPEALRRARAEAIAAFGSDELILERAVQDPRHVEVQVFADSQGATVHLFERDCSVQRRHQKVLEEAPCPILTPQERAGMGAAAVQAAQAIGYTGAGTVEFLRDASGDFFFLEMNTRLQVEHPVTELVTGLDLVALQLDVAEGAVLPFSQGDLSLDGHAIEARLYAEDPARDFLPSSGRLVRWQTAEGPGLRTDSGVVEGLEVSPFYDPMLAKVIAHGPDRDTARRRLMGALSRTVALGLTTNRDFLIALLETDAFAKGTATTALIGELFPDGFALEPTEEERRDAARLWRAAAGAQARAAAAPIPAELMNWASNGGQPARAPFADGGVPADATPPPRVPHALTADALHVHFGARTHIFPLASVDSARAGDAPDRITAPMAGAVTALEVAAGDSVTAGQTIAIIEAMKMQHTLRAAMTGRIAELTVSAGEQIAAGALIARIED